MDAVGVGLVGCGTVGSALVRRLAGRNGAGLRLEAVAVAEVGRTRVCELPPQRLGDDPLDVVEDPRVDVLVEVTGTLQPARQVVTRALDLGKPVVTANKALLGDCGPQLRAQAVEKGVPLLSDAAVLGAMPVLRALQAVVASDRIERVEGVLDSTANFVLSRMEQANVELAEALVDAGEAGYGAATTPRALDGSDAAETLSVLVQHALDEPLRSCDVQRLRADWFTPDDIARARARGRRWRVVATAVRGRCARVEPLCLPEGHPFSQMTGGDASVVVSTHRSGRLTFTGPANGGELAASALLGDLATAAAWTARRGYGAGLLTSMMPT